MQLVCVRLCFFFCSSPCLLCYGNVRSFYSSFFLVQGFVLDGFGLCLFNNRTNRSRILFLNEHFERKQTFIILFNVELTGFFFLVYSISHWCGVYHFFCFLLFYFCSRHINIIRICIETYWNFRSEKILFFFFYFSSLFNQCDRLKTITCKLMKRAPSEKKRRKCTKKKLIWTNAERILSYIFYMDPILRPLISIVSSSNNFLSNTNNGKKSWNSNFDRRGRGLKSCHLHQNP